MRVIYLGSSLTYENSERYNQKRSLRFKAQDPIERAKKSGFPNCKGLYPDCPEKPDKNNKMCRICPALDED